MYIEPKTRSTVAIFYQLAVLLWASLPVLFSEYSGGLMESSPLWSFMFLFMPFLGMFYGFFALNKNYWYFSFHDRLEKVTYWLEETSYIWILLAILVLYLPLFVYISLWFVYMLVAEWLPDFWHFMTEKRSP